MIWVVEAGLLSWFVASSPPLPLPLPLLALSPPVPPPPLPLSNSPLTEVSARVANLVAVHERMVFTVRSSTRAKVTMWRSDRRSIEKVRWERVIGKGRVGRECVVRKCVVRECVRRECVSHLVRVCHDVEVRS